ncbi:MAG: TnpV protein, partial [Clostridia bacterium]|nr:TnpV protein [Clostridia bacterium]
LKRRDQMAWVGAMNNIRARADEIVRAELIEV